MYNITYWDFKMIYFFLFFSITQKESPINLTFIRLSYAKRHHLQLKLHGTFLINIFHINNLLFIYINIQFFIYYFSWLQYIKIIIIIIFFNILSPSFSHKFSFIFFFLFIRIIRMLIYCNSISRNNFIF